MTTENQIQTWKEKFLSISTAFKQTLFEREMPAPQKGKNYRGLLGLGIIFVFEVLLLTQVLLMQGSNYSEKDSEALKIAYKLTEIINSGEISLIFKPEYFNIADFEPPMYYLSFVPIFLIFPTKVNLAIIFVNSLYMLLTCVFVFFIVRRNRSNQSVWLAVSIVMSFPFMLNLSRHVMAEIALIAWVSGAYCCYINSMEFENKKWSYLFGLCLAFGMFTHTSFWIYVLPIAPYVLDAFLNPLVKKRVFYILLFALAFNMPWYFRNTIFGFLLNLFVERGFDFLAFYKVISIENIFKNITSILDSLHIIFLVPCFIAIIWMFFSILMPSWRKLIFIWFFVPYLIFSLVLPGDAKKIYPSLIPFAVAIGLMTPDKFRKYFISICLFLSFIYQSNWMFSKRVEIFGNKVSIFGLDFVKTKKLKHKEVLEFINNENTKPGIINISLSGQDEYFNAAAFSILARKLGYKNFNFVNYGKDFIGFADFVICKTWQKSFHIPQESGDWFLKTFREIASFDLNDSEKLIVYKKELPNTSYLEPGRHFFEKITIGSINLEDVLIETGSFDRAKKVYSYFEIFVPYLSYEGLDIYSLKIRFKDFSFVPADDKTSNIKVLSCKNAEILLLRVLDESVNKFLRRKTKYFENLSIKFDKGISILGERANIRMKARFSILLEPSKIGVKLNTLSLAGLGLSLGAEPMSDSIEIDYEDKDSFLNKKIASVLKDKNIKAKMAKSKQEISQFMDEKTARELLEVGGYRHLVAQITDNNSGDKSAENTKISPDNGLLIKAVDIFLKIFSFNFNLLDEKMIPFPIFLKKISMKNGMLIIHK